MTSTSIMRSRIAGELNRRPTDIIGPSSLSVGMAINREINAALRHYESTRVWWTEVRDWVVGVTVDGTRYYSLTTDFLQFDSLVIQYNSSRYPLKERTWDEIVDKDRSIDDIKGIPQDYVIYANQIRLFPVPNQSLTMVGAYVRRELPTSLTGSYTVTASHSPTSTESHHNRLGGWYEHGEELIRQRAKAAVQINYLRDTNARTEMAILDARGESFLSMLEKRAYSKLVDMTKDRLASGRIRPYFI